MSFSPFPFPSPSPRCCLTRNPFFIPLPRACKSLTCTFRNLHYNASLPSLPSLSLFHHDATICVRRKRAFRPRISTLSKGKRRGRAMTCETERRRSRKRTKRKSLAGGRRDSGTGRARLLDRIMRTNANSCSLRCGQAFICHALAAVYSRGQYGTYARDSPSPRERRV